MAKELKEAPTQPKALNANNTEAGLAKREPIAMAVKEPVSVAKQEQKSSISEAPAPTTVNEAQKTTEVSEKTGISRIEELKNMSFRTAVEEAEFQNLLDEQNKDKNDKKVGKVVKDKDKERPDEEKFKLETGDLIDYMYSKWIVGGVEWSLTKSCFYLEVGAYNLRRKFRNKNEAKGKVADSNIFKNIKENDKKSTDKMEAFDKKVNSYNKAVEIADKMASGKIDDINDKDLSPSMKNILKSMSNDERNSFAIFAKKSQEHLKDNLKAANQFATLYADAKTFEMWAKDKNDPKITTEGFEKVRDDLKKQAAATFMAKMREDAEQGKDIKKSSKELIGMANEAYQNIYKDVSKGRTDQFDKKPKEYGFLTKRTTTADIDKKLEGVQAGSPQDMDKFMQDSLVKESMKEQDLSGLKKAIFTNINNQAKNSQRQLRVADLRAMVEERQQSGTHANLGLEGQETDALDSKMQKREVDRSKRLDAAEKADKQGTATDVQKIIIERANRESK